MPISKELKDSLEIWFDEADFRCIEPDEDGMPCVNPFDGFHNANEKERVTKGITHEVLADFLDWVFANLKYESWMVRAIVHDYLGIGYDEGLRYWE